MIRNLALAVISGALLAATTAGAAQASTPFCGANGSGRCQSDHGNTSTGAAVYTENRNPGPNQDLSLQVNHGACNNGNPTDTCPLNDHAQDHALKVDGALIETEHLDTGPCIAVNTAGNAIVAACNAQGTDYVVFNSGNGRQLINVWASNNISPDGQPQYLDNSADTGGRVRAFDGLPITNWGH